MHDENPGCWAEVWPTSATTAGLVPQPGLEPARHAGLAALARGVRKAGLAHREVRELPPKVATSKLKAPHSRGRYLAFARHRRVPLAARRLRPKATPTPHETTAAARCARSGICSMRGVRTKPPRSVGHWPLVPESNATPPGSTSPTPRHGQGYGALDKALMRSRRPRNAAFRPGLALGGQRRES